MSSGDDAHVLLGAYILGGLTDDDRRVFTEHLRTCTACQHELGQVSGLTHLLYLARPTGGPHVMPDAVEPDDASTPDRADSGVTSLLAEVSRRRRRRRWWVGAIGVAAAVGTFVLGGLLGPGLFATTAPTAHIVATAPSGLGARVDVVLVTRGWGTQLDLDCSDLPTGAGPLLLWVTDTGGRSTSVASWRVTPNGYARVTGATALSPNEIRSLQVKTSTGTTIASATT
ncbi:MAG: zf-HC2 domain-containing protein [Terracoccus sp.]